MAEGEIALSELAVASDSKTTATSHPSCGPSSNPLPSREPLVLERSSSSSDGDDSGCDTFMDISLTDMQWLQKMDAGADFPGLDQAAIKRRAKEGDRHKGKEGCRKKLDYSSKRDSNKPPLSYASMIALAICSTPKRMLTLSSIYRWIETTFPFYRTPEAKAWKQCPPRRGNGSYWTLLPDGEEELKRAVPLFSTLQPPVIDENSTYNRLPSTHTVRSKGQYVPILPHAEFPMAAMQHYFSTATAPPQNTDQNEKEENALSSGSGEHPHGASQGMGSKRRHWDSQVEFSDVNPPSHSNDENAPPSSSVGLSTPKRQCLSGISVHRPLHERDRNQPQTSVSLPLQGNKPATATMVTRPVAHGLSQHDSSLSLLDSSLLSPMKGLLPDVDLEPISLSPLYNFVSPHTGTTPLNSPFNPFRTTTGGGLALGSDSGVFSPLKTDALKFSTPMKGLSPFSDLFPPNTFSTPQHDFFSLPRFLDSSSGSLAGTPSRNRSLQSFYLLGQTPPSSHLGHTPPHSLPCTMPSSMR